MTTSTRPLIGISSYREIASWGVWEASADLLPSVYARSVEAAGGLVALLPPQGVGAAEIVGRLDGLVIAGGADIDPHRYGQTARPRTVSRPDRDGWEFALLDAARAAQLPTLGICRGMQALAVHAGGQLEQHLPDVVGHDEHAPGGSAFGWISVRTEPGSRVRALVGEQMQVSCHHHQSVVSAPGLDIVARAADGTAEALEAPGEAFWLGVQWHPESGDDYGLFSGLVEAARSHSR